MLRIRYLSRIQFFHPGSRDQKGTGSRIRNTGYLLATARLCNLGRQLKVPLQGSTVPVPLEAAENLPAIGLYRNWWALLEAMLWIRGSVTFWYGSGSAPLTNGSGSGTGSCYCRPWPSRRHKKTRVADQDQDPDWIRIQSDKKIKKFHILKSWMFSFDSWRLLL